MTDQPDDREGVTRSIRVGAATLYVTVDQVDGKPDRIFIRSDFSAPDSLDGHTAQGLISLLGHMITLSIRAGVPCAKIAAKLRRHRFPPNGLPGQTASLGDGIADAIDPPDETTLTSARHCDRQGGDGPPR